MDIKYKNEIQLKDTSAVFLHGSDMLDFAFENQIKINKSLLNISALDLNIKNLFNNSFKIDMNKSNYIIIDFVSTVLKLIKEDINSQGENETYFDNNFIKSYINKKYCLDVTDNEWQSSMNNYISLISQYFNNDNIILIRTTIPKLRTNYTILKPYIDDKINIINDTLLKLEDYFIAKLNPYIVDLSKYYFLDNSHKYYESYVCFEPSYNKDIINNIDYVINNNPSIRLYDTPNYEYKLNRFLQFYDNIYHKHMMKVAMDESDIVDSIVLCMSEKTIRANYNDIIYLKKCNHKNYDEIINNHDFKNSDYFKQMVMEIIHILKKDITNKDVVLSIVFKEKLMALWPLEKLIEEKFKKINLGKEIIVNENNIESYYKILTLYFNRQYKKTISSLLDLYNNSNQPILIDNWGSCISRVPLNGDTTKYKVENFICRCCCLDEFDEPADTSDINFSNNMYFGSRWFNRRFKESLEKTSKNTIANSTAEWMVIDFFDIINDLAIFRNVIIDYSMDNRNTQFIKESYKECTPFSYYDKPDELVKVKMDKFIDFIKSKYNNNIILVNLVVEEYYLDGQRKIKYLNTKDAKMKNEFVDKWQKYFREKTNCYCIDIAKYFLADDLTAYGANVVHYEKAFNEEIFRHIDYIIQKQPEEKLIDDYSEKYKIDRLIMLKSNNDDLSIVKPLFEYSQRDKYLYNLGLEELKTMQEQNQ